MTAGIGIVGCGTIARRGHLPGFKAAGANIAAFASRTLASAEAAASEWGSGKVLADWRELVALDEVEAVDVCTPNALHAEIAVAAARAGKHVLVEKPIAATLDQADAMVAAAREAGVILMTAHNVRYAAPMIAMRDEVAGGAIGDVVGVRAAFGHGGPRAWAPDSDWFFDPEQSGGGALIDLGIHVTDLLRAVVGDEVEQVSAVLRPGAFVEDAAQVILRFSRGAIASMHISWIVEGGRDLELHLFGNEGSLHFTGSGPPLVRRGAGEPQPVAVPQDPPSLFADFLGAVASGSPPPVTGEDGRAALAIVDAAYRSAREGRTLSPR